jgi:peptidoglycan/LPS O-acetylase OafA/YrhL
MGRLFPAFWAAVVITAALQAFWRGGRRPGFVDTVLNLTMMPSLFDATPVQVVFWTLLVELRFYVIGGLFIAVVLYVRRRRGADPVGAPLPAAGIAALAVGWPVAADVVHRIGWSTAAEWLVAEYAPYFGAGMVLYLLRRDGVRRRAWALAALSANLALAVVHVVGRTQAANALQGVRMSPAVAVTAVLLFIAAIWWASGPRAVVTNRRLAAALTWGASITYGVFLVHSQFGFAVIDAAAPHVPKQVAVAAAVATSIAVGWLIHRFVERPFNAPLRRATSAFLTRVAHNRT